MEEARVVNGNIEPADCAEFITKERVTHLIKGIRETEGLHDMPARNSGVYGNEASYINNDGPLARADAENQTEFYYIVADTISLLRNGLPAMTMSGSRSDGSKSKDHKAAKCIVKPFALIDRQWKHVSSALYT